MTEVEDFTEVVRRQLDQVWSVQSLRAEAPVTPVWDTAIAAGWFDLSGEHEVSVLVATSGVFGAAACPLPLADVFVAGEILPEPFRGQLLSGQLRLVIAAHSEDLRCRVELPEEINAVLMLGDGLAELRSVVSYELTGGIPLPRWGRASLGEPMWTGTPHRAVTERARTLLRLTLAARSLGAAERLHEMAVEHAKTRVQFGRQIGSFGAVQQRTATCQIDVVAARQLIAAAATALDAGAAGGELATELAHGFVGAAARRILLGAHHTLAAVGFFEEHAGPWLFRRVHADIAAAADLIGEYGTAVDRLLEGATQLPSFETDAGAESFRATVREVAAQLVGRDRNACIAALVSHGWLGIGWPEEFGGHGASMGEEVVLNEELTYARLPVEIEMASVTLLGNAILAHGSPEQRSRFLPLVRRGEMRFCLGYSEPETGSDLASVRTRAERDGDSWVINGQKIWTTRADQADYIWLATRTNPDAHPRHAGITVFLVPMSTPGIEVVPMTALSGERAATVFLDDVRVPDSARVGEVDGGWAVITHALIGERVVMGGVAAHLHRVLDDVLAVARRDQNVAGPRGSARRYLLDQAICELQALRGLVALATASEGIEALVAAPMAGVLGGELAESFAERLLDIVGAEALLDDPGGIGGGAIQQLLRQAVMYVVGGGTNDIQRGIIARSLGLPR